MEQLEHDPSLKFNDYRVWELLYCISLKMCVRFSKWEFGKKYVRIVDKSSLRELPVILPWDDVKRP